MSNVNHQLKTILIHNAKAAGTSMYLALNMEHSHDTQEQSRAKHSEYWDQYFKFAFVRSPVDRAISTYEFVKMDRSWYHDNISPNEDGRHGDRQKDYERVQGKSLDDCLQMLLDDPKSLTHPGWRPQSQFISDPDELDFLGRYERLEADWETLTGLLRVRLPLEKINVTKQLQDRRKYYTLFAVEACKRLYAADYLNFNYPLTLPFVSISAGNEQIAQIKKGCNCSRK